MALSTTRDRAVYHRTYLLGYCPHLLPAEAQTQWELADAGDPFPLALYGMIVQAKLAAEELPSLPGGDGLARLAAEYSVSLAGAQSALERAWGGHEHGEFMTYRNQAEELDSVGLLEDAPHRSPVGPEVWAGLAAAADALVAALPQPARDWGGLGAAVARVLQGDRGEAYHRLQLLHSALGTEWPLAELDLSNAAYIKALRGWASAGALRLTQDQWVVGEVGGYHTEVLRRLGNGPPVGPPPFRYAEPVESSTRSTSTAGTTVGANPALADGNEVKREDKPSVSKKVLAIAYLTQHPDETDQQVAEAVGVSRTSVYRWPEYVKLRETLKSRRQDLPRGNYHRVTAASGKLEMRLEAVAPSPTDEGED